VARKRIGEFFQEQGLLKPEQVEEILVASKTKGLRFGDASLLLGYTTAEQMAELFGPAWRTDYYHLEPEALDAGVSGALGLAETLRLGALPLALAQGQLSVGSIAPDQPGLEAEIARAVARALPGAGSARPKLFLVLPTQFIRAVERLHGVDAPRILSLPEAAVHPTLRQHLQQES
jgi:hypothetical protein